MNKFEVLNIVKQKYPEAYISGDDVVIGLAHFLDNSQFNNYGPCSLSNSDYIVYNMISVKDSMSLAFRVAKHTNIVASDSKCYIKSLNLPFKNSIELKHFLGIPITSQEIIDYAYSIGFKDSSNEAYMLEKYITSAEGDPSDFKTIRVKFNLGYKKDKYLVLYMNDIMIFHNTSKKFFELYNLMRITHNC